MNVHKNTFEGTEAPMTMFHYQEWEAKKIAALGCEKQGMRRNVTRKLCVARRYRAVCSEISPASEENKPVYCPSSNNWRTYFFCPNSSCCDQADVLRRHLGDEAGRIAHSLTRTGQTDSHIRREGITQAFLISGHAIGDLSNILKSHQHNQFG